MKVIIAEDERLAREELLYLLSKAEDVEMLPSTTTGKELLEAVERYKPDAVFLDIRMPEIDGIEVARMLVSKPECPYIVFTTAYEEYAIEAFHLDAVDYLLKPYSRDRLNETLARMRTRIKAIESQDTLSIPKINSIKDKNRFDKIHKLLLDDKNKTVVVEPETILYAVKEDKSIVIHTANGEQYVSRFTLLELEQKLAPFSFFRSHRSYLVNVNWIGEIEQWFNGAYNIILKDTLKNKIPVSRECAKELFSMLKGN
jgi:two-component system response regulator LytT